MARKSSQKKTEAPQPGAADVAPLHTNKSADIKPPSMEVHHHPSVEKKSFKEYLLEGLMIFLAVTMGFFAESLREHIADHDKEVQYIESMIQDARKDTANYQVAIDLNNKRAFYLDSLAKICATGIAVDVPGMYRLYRHGMVHPDFVLPVERTITQLNTGGMRLIGKKAAADSIISYDSFGKKLSDQQGYYELYQNKFADAGFTMFNWKYWFDGTNKNRPDYQGAELLSTGKKELIELGNHTAIYKGVVAYYAIRLEECKQHAVNLINTLKKEYNIQDE